MPTSADQLLELLGGTSGYSPEDIAARKLAVLRTMGMSEQDRQKADAQQATMYDKASQQAAYGGIASGGGSPNIAAMGKAAIGEGTKEQDRIMRYGPQVQLLNRAKAALGYAGKVDVAGTRAQSVADTNASRKGIADDRNASAERIAKIRAGAVKNGPAPKILKDDDGKQYWVTPGQPPQLITGDDGQPLTLKKPLSSSELSTMTGFDSALSRLQKLKTAFAKGVGTYPGAGTIHELAQVVDAADPNFAELKTVAGGHLLKGIKADIGGRITNFEIKYGAHLFPTENDRPAVAMAKIRVLEEMLSEDKTNFAKVAKKANRKVPTDDAPIDLTK